MRKEARALAKALGLPANTLESPHPPKIAWNPNQANRVRKMSTRIVEHGQAVLRVSENTNAALRTFAPRLTVSSTARRVHGRVGLLRRK
jgi:hypothetical protein